jgi:hypothetical protein
VGDEVVKARLMNMQRNLAVPIRLNQKYACVHKRAKRSVIQVYNLIDLVVFELAKPPEGLRRDIRAAVPEGNVTGYLI